MASIDSTDNSTPVHDLQTGSEKNVQTQSDFSGEIERSPEEARETKPDDATKFEDAGPPDGGAAAWLNVLGAWCCSFSSPGWVNSTYFPSFQCIPRLSRCGF